MVGLMPGGVKSINYYAESSYGTPPATALIYGGATRHIKPGYDSKKEFFTDPDSRSFGRTAEGVIEVNPTIRAFARLTSGGYDWRNFWAVYAMGSTSGLTTTLGSFLMQTAKSWDGGSTVKYNFYHGCKMNKLSIIGEKPGQPIVFEAEIKAQMLSYGTSKTIAQIYSQTIGADASEVTTAYLSWAGNLQINLGGGGLANFYPKDWKLTIDNKITPTSTGIVVGADTKKYPVAVGMSEGGRDIIFEATVAHESETYVNAKIANTAVTSLTIPLDTWTVTLSNGEFVADDLADVDAESTSSEEKIRIKFKSLSIA